MAGLGLTMVCTNTRRTTLRTPAASIVFGFKAAVLVWAAIAAGVQPSGVRAEDSTATGVLILHSNQRPTPAQIVVEDTLRTEVPDGLKRPVQLFSEYLDDEWASLQTYGAAQADFLRDKYARRNVKVIVANALPALRFAMQFRDRMLPGVPIVHIAVAWDRVDRSAFRMEVLGNFEDNDPTPTLRLAMHLHPDARRFVFIRGASDLDRFWDQRLRTAAEQMDSGLDVEYLDGLPTDEVLRRVGALSGGTIVFTPGYFVDGAGQVTTPRQVIERIAAASAVPVYGAFDTQMGAGIVGGYMARYEDQAKQAGATVVRLLSGAMPSEVASGLVTRVPMVDWRQLRRWNIDERMLPAGTIVRFREPTAWDKYWREICVGIAVVLFQAALIASLLIERRSRHRTTLALEESQKHMHLAGHAARLSTWIWDTTRDKLRGIAPKRQHANPLGEPPIPLNEVLASAHPADRRGLEQAVEKALASGDELDIEYRVVGREGDVRWVAARGRAEQGDTRRLLGVALDVTERKAADLRAAQDRTALRHMMRVSMAGQLSAAIAHQLNQPLAAILGNAEAAQKMLSRENVDLTELRAICGDIVSEDRRAADVIRRLSELYKRTDANMAPTNLNELIRETLDMMRTELLIRHVTPVIDLTADLPAIDAAYIQLQQLVLNLVLNAADAMTATDAAARTLTVRTDRSGGEIRLSLIDNGMGIPASVLDKVFDPFWSTKAEGMGMGLAICQSIVTAHRGHITARNNAGGGATFCVTLPMTQRA